MALAVALVAVLPHWPALDAGYTYDDLDFVERNAAVRSLGSALEGFLAPFPPEQPARGLFRPLTPLSYALDRAIFGEGPAGHHAANLIWFALSAAVAVLLARRLLGHPAMALAAAAIWALHPVHTEAVDSITGRSELLAFFFGALTLLALLRAMGARGPGQALWSLASALALLLSALSKESGSAYAGVAALYLLARPGSFRRSRRLLLLLPHAAALGLFFALRALALGGRFVPDSTVLGHLSLPERLPTLGRASLEYLRLLFWPATLEVDLFYERTVGPTLHWSPAAVAGILAVITLVCAGLWGLARAPRGGDPAAATEPSAAPKALLAGLGLMVPVSHLIPFGALLAERFLHGPSFFFCVAGVAAIRPFWRRRGLLVAAPLLLLLLSAAAARSWVRAEEWHDPVTLWTPVLRAVKDDYRVYNSLAAGLIKRRELRRAIPLLEMSLRLQPGFPRALNNLGYALMEQGSLGEAEKIFEDLVAREPSRFLAWNNLGVIAARRGDNALAARRYRRALALNPNYATARRNLQAVEAAMEAARAYLREHRASTGPESPAAQRAAVARACFAAGDYDCARALSLPR